MEQPDTNDLLNRAKQKDIDAYMQLMYMYGSKVHKRLLEQIGDRNLADAAFQKTTTGFYKMLTKNPDEDAVETILNFYADCMVRQTVTQNIPNTTESRPEQRAVIKPEEQPQRKPQETPPEQIAHADEPAEQRPEKRKQKKKKKSGSVGLTIGIVLLILGILAVLWIIAGLLMDMHVLPELDLGYSWFDTHIAPLL